ncbi:MAG: HAD hydrolase-like protein [Candidatus Zambryskibacteria bacterium]|nr:HAD hydrolase-like protein [Candidatus Zambryskibacteria bacterium]
MIKVVLFDVDGVLVRARRMFSVNLEREYGISTEKTSSFFLGPFKECLVGKADLKNAIEPYLKEWGWQKGVDALIEYWFKSEDIVDSSLIEYVQSLRRKGIKCYLATNQENYRVDHMLNTMGFAQNFDGSYASSHIGYVKPDAEFFARIYENLDKIKKDEILFWDNTLENIEGAQTFGIQARLYTTFENFKETMRQEYAL